jgi:hypothetical protein
MQKLGPPEQIKLSFQGEVKVYPRFPKHINPGFAIGFFCGEYSPMTRPSPSSVPYPVVSFVGVLRFFDFRKSNPL